MTQPEAALANCPFCGGHGGIFSEDGDYFIGCGQCWSQSPNKKTEAEAIAAWNTRASTPPPPSEPLVERVRDFVYDCTRDEFGNGWTLSKHQTEDLIKIAALPAPADDVVEALRPFAELFDLRWAEYTSASDCAPISLGFATHGEKRRGDLQLSDFREASAALAKVKSE